MSGKAKLIVVKIGGNVIDDEAALHEFIQNFSALEGHKILVHGGGKLATGVATAMGIEQQMVEGRRITDADTLRVVTMVYAGYINKQIVSLLQAAGCNALGLSGADGNLIRAHKRLPKSDVGKAGVDYGFAGDVDEVNSPMLQSLMLQGFSPVLSPITHNAKGQLLNTNADTIAAAVATSLAPFFEVGLIFCFDKKGVLADVVNNESLIPIINQQNHQELLRSGLLFEGIIPKIDNAFAAINQGVSRVVIGHASDLLSNCSNKVRGTLIQAS